MVLYFFIQKEKAYFQVKNSRNKVLKIKFDEKQNVKSYDIIENDTSIKIETIKVDTTNEIFKRGLVRELLDSFVRRMEELINEIKMLIITRLLY